MVDTSELIKLYEEGTSMTALAKKYVVSTYKIKRILKENNIYIRSRNEQNKYNPQNQRQYHINDNYFDTENPNMAYLLGFLAADGYVYQHKNSIKISLSDVDTGFLELIEKELNANFPIRHYETKDGYHVCEVVFTSHQIKMQLFKYGIVPKKTYSFTFPYILNEKYYIDFIRGYFDGDGSVSTAGRALRWQLCSYNKEFLISVLDILEKYNIPKVNIYKRNNLYYFQYSTNSTKQLFNILYYDNCLCLPRKYKKYCALLMK